jgi:hypothetical protein
MTEVLLPPNPSSSRTPQLAPNNHALRISYSHDRDAVHAAINASVLFVSNNINLTEIYIIIVVDGLQDKREVFLEMHPPNRSLLTGRSTHPITMYGTFSSSGSWTVIIEFPFHGEAQYCGV